VSEPEREYTPTHTLYYLFFLLLPLLPLHILDYSYSYFYATSSSIHGRCFLLRYIHLHLLLRSPLFLAHPYRYRNILDLNSPVPSGCHSPLHISLTPTWSHRVPPPQKPSSLTLVLLFQSSLRSLSYPILLVIFSGSFCESSSRNFGYFE